ncbi:MAG TPA: hypothetical protein VJG67_01865 [Candidatus Paceibacterota bacterium]
MSELLTKAVNLLTGDGVFLLVIFAVFFVYAMYLGRGRIISLILSFYPATLLYNAFPFIDKLTMSSEKGLVLGKIGIFLVFLIPINIILNRYVFAESFYTGTSHMIRTGGLALVTVILVILFSYNTVNFDVLHDFSPGMDIIFSGASREFWWNLTPLAILAFL